jgi:hypothetical protein
LLLKTYQVSLYNKSTELDLRKKKTDIVNVLNYLSVINRSQKDVTYAKLISIEQHSMVIEVGESETNWHKTFGKTLASNFGMRDFCDPMDKSRLFKWNLRYKIDRDKYKYIEESKHND